MDTTTKYEMDSDIEHDSDDGLPNVKAWGKKKSIYFGTDYVDKDFRKRAGQDEEELAQQEEEEAKAIQMRLLEEINEEDLDLNRLPDVREDGDKTVQKVQIDVDSLTKREKLQLLKKEAPELTSLVDDFKSSLAELEKQKRILNYKNVDDVEAFHSSLPYQVLRSKFNLLTRYCMNISFYLLLKSKGKSIGNHPCASNLLDLKKMILTIEKIENKKQFKLLVNEFLDKIEKNGKILMNKESEEDEEDAVGGEIDLRDFDDNNEGLPTPRKRVRFFDDKATDNDNREVDEDDIELREYGDLRDPEDEDDEDEDDDEEFDDLDLEDEEEDEPVKGVKKSNRKDQDEEMDEDETTRRPINYQIAKNKGLTPKKPKEQRNPRVKHRMKYKKAKARRRGQVRELRKEIKKYSGEISGIRSSTVKSIKFK